MTRWPESLPRGLVALLFAGALAGAFWRAPAPAAPAFVAPPPAAASTLPPVFTAEMLPAAAASARAPSLVQLPDSRIAAAWLAGPEDNGEGNAIWFSRLDREGWSQPGIVASRESTAGGSLAYLARIANPVLYIEGSWLHLWYVSVAIGSGAAGSLNHGVSTDGGANWSKPARLQTSPLANLGTLAHSPPLPLADGGLGLALEHPLLVPHGAWLRLSATGRILDKLRLPQVTAATPPALVALDEQRALALLGATEPAPGQMQVAATGNGGLLWSTGPAGPSVGPRLSPNAPLAVLRLKSGRLLLAGNPESGRQTLQLWISADQGATWQASRRIETAPDGAAEFTDPALLLGRDGRIHLAYSWRRQGIKHAAFSEAWLDGGQP